MAAAHKLNPHLLFSGPPPHFPTWLWAWHNNYSITLRDNHSSSQSKSSDRFVFSHEFDTCSYQMTKYRSENLSHKSTLAQTNLVLWIWYFLLKCNWSSLLFFLPLSFYLKMTHIWFIINPTTIQSSLESAPQEEWLQMGLGPPPSNLIILLKTFSTLT